MSSKQACRYCNGKGFLPTRESLKTKRQRRGASQKKVAELMKIDAAYLSRLENGKSGWTVDMIGRFEAALEQV